MRLSIVAGTLLAGVLALGCTTPARAQPAPLHIDVIVSQTGSFAFVGQRTVETLHVIEGVVNRNGGVNGRPVQFDFSDDQTSAVVSVQLANAAIARGVPVLLGPVSAAGCAAVVPLVEKNGPLDYCLSPVTNGPPGSYVFSVGAGTAANNIVMIRFFRNKGWKRIGLIASIDASCREGERLIDEALQLPENRDVQIVARGHFNPTDMSVAAQFAQIKSAAPQALLTCASGTIFGTVLHGIHDAGLEVPTAASSANMVSEQLAGYAALLPHELYFAASRGIVRDDALGSGPVKASQRRYFDAFGAAHVKPEFQASLIWDQSMIVIDALRHAGPTPTAAKLRAYIEDLHDWAGIAGIYYFRDNSQRGIGQSALQVYRWDGAHTAFTVVSRPAGRLNAR
jgi:branched-chain amino acid transport system substrate-binding protein